MPVIYHTRVFIAALLMTLEDPCMIRDKEFSHYTATITRILLPSIFGKGNAYTV
jgi:hypothetical protein